MSKDIKVRKKSKKSISIKTWLIICFAFVIVFIIVAQSVFNLLFLEPLFIYHGKLSIEKSFYTVKESYSDSGDFSELNDLAIILENKYGIKLTLMTEDGSIYSSEYTNFEFEQQFGGMQRGEDAPEADSEPPEADGEATDSQLLEKENAETGDSSLKSLGQFLGYNTDDFSQEPEIKISEQSRDGKSIVLTGKFTQDDKDVYVIMSISLESISSTVTVFSQMSAGILAFALIIAIIISVFISKWIARPVVDVEGVAEKIAQLDFDSRANETVPLKELGSLAVSVNSMSDSLKETIEDLRVANEALQKDLDYQKHIEKMRREFIANVSHEMKTPLGLLQIYSENLKNNVENIDKDRYCDVIIEETENLNEMVMSMLDISSIENGLSKMNFEIADLSELCNETAGKFTPMLEKFVVSSTIESEIYVTADKKYIEQAMKNYISNAINHTPNGGKIEISLKKDGGSAVFTVKNEGRNIADEDIANLWDAFYKSDKARTRTPGNNVGLGLYIVKTVIEKHSGEYGVRNIQGGVEFYFTLPVQE
ncbi:MAG: HAMP domain-containing histidine kinase [Clostridiales bacterium]|nr:HAMP domain-containing histidine kinase [Clostridiales bacterium]